MSSVVMSGDRSRFLINNSTVNMINASTRSNAWHLLFNHISTGAFDNTDEYEQMKCHPGTRTILLERLEDWVAAPGNAERLLQWLDGPMGSGKTAIARTMADRTAAKGELIGTFIFSRTAPGRNTEDRLVTTLAYQLGSSIPLVQSFIESQIDEDPSILQQSLYAQLEGLILAPLRQMRKHHPSMDVTKGPRLIIVDGLDECGGFNPEGSGSPGPMSDPASAVSKEDRQLKVLDILSKLVQAQDVLPFIVLLHSRPEPHIKGWIKRHPSFSFRITLDGSLSPNDDIRLFVEHNIAWIKEKHPNAHLLPFDWPCNIQPYLDQPRYLVNAIEWIVERSSGQFIYASVAMKFIRSQRHHPAERLLLLIHGSSSDRTSEPLQPQEILDDLYHQVFKAAINPTKALRILACHRILPYSLRRSVLSFKYYSARNRRLFIPLSRLEHVLSLTEAEIKYCLQDLEALLEFSRYPLIKFHHASIMEFLMDETRAREWYMDTTRFAAEFASASLARIKDEQYTGAQRSYHVLLSIFLGRLQDAPNVLDQRTRAQLLWELVETTLGSMSSNMDEKPWYKMGYWKYDISLILEVMDVLEDPQKRVEAHFATWVQPYISTYLRDPSSFSLFLHWVFALPIGASDFENVDALSGPSNAKWQIPLRSLFLSCPRAHLESISVILNIFRIPSETFLQESMIIMFENSVLSVKSRVLHSYPERYWGNLFWFLHVVLNGQKSLKLWHYLCNSDANTLKPWFRDLMRKDLRLRYAFSRAQLFSPPNHNVEPCSPFDLALATHISNDFQQWSMLTHPVPHLDYQLTIPGIRQIGWVKCHEHGTTLDDDFERDVTRCVDESVAGLTAMQAEHSELHLKKIR